MLNQGNRRISISLYDRNLHQTLVYFSQNLKIIQNYNCKSLFWTILLLWCWRNETLGQEEKPNMNYNGKQSKIGSIGFDVSETNHKHTSLLEQGPWYRFTQITSGDVCKPGGEKQISMILSIERLNIKWSFQCF